MIEGYVTYGLYSESGVGNRESGLGSRESGVSRYDMKNDEELGYVTQGGYSFSSSHSTKMIPVTGNKY